MIADPLTELSRSSGRLIGMPGSQRYSGPQILDHSTEGYLLRPFPNGIHLGNKSLQTNGLRATTVGAM
jgi:hypothetical protein